MPFMMEAIPGVAVFVAIVWEVHCYRAGNPGRYCCQLWCVVMGVWVLYYTVLGIRDFRTQDHALAIVAFGLALIAGSLGRKALRFTPAVAPVAQVLIEDELVDPAGNGC